MKFTQIGKPVIVLCILIEVLLIWAVLGNTENLSFEQIVAFNTIPLSILLLFYKLEITATDTNILIVFGIGLIKKRIPLHTIQEARLTKNAALAGWGVQYTTEYTLYNVGGMDSVELLLKDKLRSVRVGCDDPLLLCNHINDKILKQSY